jgi:hypothetical protein
MTMVNSTLQSASAHTSKSKCKISLTKTEVKAIICGLHWIGEFYSDGGIDEEIRVTDLISRFRVIRDK